LIRELTAICVTSAEEMAELAPLDELRGARDDGRTASPGFSRQPGHDSSRTPSAAFNPESTRFFDALSARSGRTVDEIAAASGLSVAAVQSLIAGAEFEGTVVERERGWIKKVPRG
jgi:DNA processing protein